MDINKLNNELTRDEEYKQFPYKDTVGKLTIGIGFNLDDVGLSKEESSLILNLRTQKLYDFLCNNIKGFSTFSDARQRALINMCYNLGWEKLSGFKQTLKYIENQDWKNAADECLKSLWAKQVGLRAVRIANMLREG